MKKQIIGFGGQKESGKSTAALVLKKKYGFAEVSFAAPLKKVCAAAMGMTYATFDAPDKKDVPFEKPIRLGTLLLNSLFEYLRLYGPISETQTEYMLCKGMNKVVSTPRELLQYVGTDLIRQCVDSNFWCRAFEKELKGHDKFVIPDLRFENERDCVKSLGGTLVLIKRPNAAPSAHVSENSLGEDSEYDHVITNHSNIDDLHTSVEQCYNSLVSS